MSQIQSNALYGPSAASNISSPYQASGCGTLAQLDGSSEMVNGSIKRTNAAHAQGVPATPLREILSGENAFYRQPDYLKVTQQELASNTLLPVSYTWNSESKVSRVFKEILSIIVFPIGICQALHRLAGKVAILPASSPSLMGYPKNYATETRSQVYLENEWKHKRLTIEVDGYKIDAVIVGKAPTLGNGRWMLPSNGNGEFYEQKLVYNELYQLLNELNGNAIVFNYNGVGVSSGLPNRAAMAKGYRAMLAFLEDKEKGIGAREIIGYGHSIGGGVQGDALKNHELKKDIQYVFVKSRTFSDLSTTASLLIHRALGFLVKILGWNMDCVHSSKKLQAPEIIMQTACVCDYQELTDSSKIINDGVIPAKASLAKALLDDPTTPRENKIFIGMPEYHNGGLRDPGYLARKIEACLHQSKN